MPFEDVQIGTSAFKRNPNPFYTYLRERSPVHLVTLPDGQKAWLVARYNDVSEFLKDSRFAKDRKNAMTGAQLAKQRRAPKYFAPLMRNMLDRDDPDHARLRKLVLKDFTSRRVEMMAARTQEITDELLNRLEGRGSFDLMSDFALPLPITVISELLGVPEADRAKFARWSKTIIKNTMTPLSLLLSLPHMIGLVRYLRSLIDKKRRFPKNDLVTALVQVEDAGDQLDADELLSMVGLLLSAGHETTTNLIGNGMLALIQNPDQLERLQAEPERMESAVEELLRFASPVETSTFRYARHDLNLAGTQVAQGDLVLGVIASANRDERQFPQAEALDISRSPNKHVSFGLGGHFCVGAPLARMEGAIAFNALLSRFPRLQIAVDPDKLLWRRGLILRGVESLPLTLSR